MLNWTAVGCKPHENRLWGEISWKEGGKLMVTQDGKVGEWQEEMETGNQRLTIREKETQRGRGLKGNGRG